MIDKVIKQIETNQQATVDRLLDFLRIPSISTDPARKADTRKAGEWVKRVFDGCGIKNEMLETPGHPCILADTGPAANGGPTLLIYGHYDVQPARDEHLWNSPAFDPQIRNGSIYARGAADDKGQVLTHLVAAEAWMKVAGKLPIRVKYLIEGEEEIGSPNLEPLIRKHKDKLACNYVALSDTAKLDANTPAITYGTKGLVYKEVTLFGPKQDLHSGSYGGTVINPGNALAALIASFHDANRRVMIPGFYDDVREIGDTEKQEMGRLAFDENAYKQYVGPDVLDGEKGYSTLQRRWIRPTLDVNGMFGGFTGAGASTIIPAKMSAKVSMRLVPDQSHHRISEAFDKAVRERVPKGLRVEIAMHSFCSAYVSPLNSPGMKAAADAVAAGYGKRPVFIREGGTLPILPLFKEVLGADSLMLGFCVPDCNAHGPNEFFAIDDLHRGSKAAAHLLQLLAAS